MDHTAGKREAAGSGAGPIGTAAHLTRGSPAPAFPAEHHRYPAETPPHSGRNVAGLRRKRAALTGRETSRPAVGKRMAPGGKTGRGHTGNAQRPPGANAAGYGPADGKAAGQWRFRRNEQQAGGPPLNACRVAWRASVPDFTPLSPGQTRQFVGGGRAGTWAADGPQSVPAGRAGWTDAAAHFQITSSEIANTCSQHRNDNYPFTYGPVT
jgi:hypothetical protein